MNLGSALIDAIKKGDNLYQTKQYKQALDQYIKVLKLNPKCLPIIEVRKGETYLKLRETKRAEGCFDETLKHRDAALKLSEDKNIPEELRAEFKDVITSAYTCKASLAIKKHDYQQAVNYADLALKNAPEDKIVLFFKGEALYHLEKYPEAEQIFRKFQEFSHEDSDTKDYLSRINAKLHSSRIPKKEDKLHRLASNAESASSEQPLTITVTEDNTEALAPARREAATADNLAVSQWGKQPPPVLPKFGARQNLNALPPAPPLPGAVEELEQPSNTQVLKSSSAAAITFSLANAAGVNSAPEVKKPSVTSDIPAFNPASPTLLGSPTTGPNTPHDRSVSQSPVNLVAVPLPSILPDKNSLLTGQQLVATPNVQRKCLIG